MINESQFGERTIVCIARGHHLTRHAISHWPWLDHFVIAHAKCPTARFGLWRSPNCRCLIDQGHQLTGLDFSPDMIGLARPIFRRMDG